MVDSFAVVYYGNTGSSWLLETLGTAPGVVIPAFEPLESWAWAVDSQVKLGWLRNAFSPPEEREGEGFERWVEGLAQSPQFEQLPTKSFSTVGLKMTWNAIPDTAGLLDCLLELGTKLVFLDRNNRIKHALSLYRYHEETKSQFGGGAGVRPPSKVKLRRFDYWVEESIRLHDELNEFRSQAGAVLPADASTTVAYEDFVTPAGKAAVLEHLAGFLDFDLNQIAHSGFQKATPDDLQSALLNYQQVFRRYRRTPLAVYFED